MSYIYRTMSQLTLVQKLDRAISGWWDGGPKDEFRWKITTRGMKDKRGRYVRVGSWEANHWFHVAEGQTDKQTLANARRRLKLRTKVPCRFWYEED